MRARRILLSAVAVLAVATDVVVPGDRPRRSPRPARAGREADSAAAARARGRRARARPQADREGAGGRGAERPARGQPVLRAARRAVSTRTDATGRFRLTLRTREPQTVRVEAAGPRGGHAQGRRARHAAHVRPHGGRHDRGHGPRRRHRPAGRRTPRDRQPDAAAFPVTADPDAGRVVTATTDANGRFKLQGLASGRYYVSASGRGRGAAGRGAVRASAAASTSSSSRRARSSARCWARTAGRCPGATVSRRAAVRTGGIAEDGRTRAARSRSTASSPAIYDVIARAPGLAPAIAPEVALDRRTEARLDLVLRPGARVVGRLLDANERPVGGRVVGRRPRRQPGAARARGRAARPRRAPTAASRSRRVPPGEHALGASAPGHAARARRGRGARGRAHRWTSATCGSRSASRSAAACARRRASRSPTRSVRATAGRSMMAQRGRRGALGSGRLASCWRASSRRVPSVDRRSRRASRCRSKTAEPGGEPLELVLEPGGHHHGTRGRRARSRPVESFRVSAARSERPRHAACACRAWTETTSEDGRFTLSNVAPGSYVVSVTAPELRVDQRARREGRGGPERSTSAP